MDKSSPHLLVQNIKFKLNWKHKVLQGLEIIDTYFETINSAFDKGHQRLGHVNPKTLQQIVGIKIPENFDCYICNQNNVTERTPKLSDSSVAFQESMGLLEYIQMDIAYHPATRTGSKHTVIL